MAFLQAAVANGSSEMVFGLAPGSWRWTAANAGGTTFRVIRWPEAAGWSDQADNEE